MSDPVILLLGKSGQVGWELQRSLAPLGQLVALDSRSRDHCGDLSDLEGLAATVRKVRPAMIVNAAAYTAVDKAEGEPERARLLNALAPQVLAEAAREAGAWLMHYSTDYVFDGSGSTPWKEDDPAYPLNVYGRTKLEGEQHVALACEKHLVFRTSWVYSARGGNFAKTILRLAGERDRLTVINDQFGAPTGAELIADISAQVARQVLQNGAGAGIYHLAAAGETSWHGYASHLVETAGRLRPDMALRAQAIDPVPTSAFPTPAKRPGNSRLATDKLRRTFGLALPPWQNGVDRMLCELT